MNKVKSLLELMCCLAMYNRYTSGGPVSVAQSDARPTGDQEDAGSIPAVF